MKFIIFPYICLLFKIFLKPISLTSLLCKSLEHIIYSHVMEHLVLNNILSPYQFGKRSANLQLLLTVHDLALSLNNNIQTDHCILLDFSKVFNKVSHRLLLFKLRHYRITGKIINWFSWLTAHSRLSAMAQFQSLLMLIAECLRALYWAHCYFSSL